MALKEQLGGKLLLSGLGSPTGYDWSIRWVEPQERRPRFY